MTKTYEDKFGNIVPEMGVTNGWTNNPFVNAGLIVGSMAFEIFHNGAINYWYLDDDDKTIIDERFVEDMTILRAANLGDVIGGIDISADYEAILDKLTDQHPDTYKYHNMDALEDAVTKRILQEDLSYDIFYIYLDSKNKKASKNPFEGAIKESYGFEEGVDKELRYLSELENYTII